MAIGYACIALGVRDCGMRGCTLKNASIDRLDQITAVNLGTLSRVLEYNASLGINLFRISSDIIPFGSHPINQNHWWEYHADILHQLGDKIRQAGMRVSMHPGQYTVLNAVDDSIVERSVTDLEYHARLLDSLGVDSQHKIILHTGGRYGDTQSSLARFCKNFKLLSMSVQRRLVIENDEKYNIEQVLKLARSLEIPAVFDVFHHQCNPPSGEENPYHWLEKCRSTWKTADGIQKIHYSQQEPGLRTGAHSRSIRLQPFLNFYHRLPNGPLDIMLEVKDKDISALKCMYSLDSSPPRHLLEEEWARYKYLVMEHSNHHCQSIGKLFNPSFPLESKQFYLLVEEALNTIPKRGSIWNAAQHVWNCFKDVADDGDTSLWQDIGVKFQAGTIDRSKLKNFLKRMASKHDQLYLLNSYYFVLD